MRTAVRGTKGWRWWLVLAALGICAFVWWHEGGTIPNWAPDWLPRKAVTAERLEYRLAGGYPAAASLEVFRRLTAFSQAANNQAAQRLKEQGLVWETTEGPRVHVLNRRGSFREVQVQEVETGKSYWTYVEALEK